MKAYLIAFAIIAAAGGLAWSHSAAYRSGVRVGQASVAEKIKQENDDAGNAAEKWRGDLRRCADDGGLFDFETGACDK